MNSVVSRLAKFRRIGVLAVIGVIALMAGQAWAQAVFSSYRTADQSYADGVAHLLKLNDAGSTSMTIYVPSAATLVILFNAECSVDGTDNITWLDIDVLVDGVAVPPSDNDNAFCTDSNTGALTNWLSASTNVVKSVSAGYHRIEVRGTLRNFNAGDAFRIDDISLIVLRVP